MATSTIRRAVVFDFDGTLADTGEVWHAAERSVAASYGYDWSARDHRDLRGLGIDAAARQLGMMVGAEQHAATIEAEILDAYFRQIKRVECMPGARTIVESLAGERMLGVATNSPRDLVQAQLKLLGIAEHFSVVVAANSSLKSKPAPDVYERAAARLGSCASEIVAVEDSSTGIQAARSAGCTIIGVSRVRSLVDCWQADSLFEALDVFAWLDHHQL